jgi:hypothetical protein
MSTGLDNPAVVKRRRYLPKPFDPPNQDPLTDRWVRLASALARAAKKDGIGAQELVVALECAELMNEAAPRRGTVVSAARSIKTASAEG